MPKENLERDAETERVGVELSERLEAVISDRGISSKIFAENIKGVSSHGIDSILGKSSLMFISAKSLIEIVFEMGCEIDIKKRR